MSTRFDPGTGAIITAPSIATDSLSGRTRDATLQISGNGIGNVAVNPAIQFPTTGGTPALIAYYEEKVVSFTFTGIWAANQVINISFAKLGKIVTMTSLAAVSATSNGVGMINSTTTIPSGYMPAGSTGLIIPINVTNGSGAIGTMEVRTNGTLRISSGVAGTNFLLLVTAGFAIFTASWIAA